MSIYNLPHECVYWSRVEEHDDIKSELLPKIQGIDRECVRDDNPYPKYKFRTNIKNTDTFIIEDTILHKVVWKHVYDFINKLDFHMVSPHELHVKYWYNIYQDGDFQEVHHHKDITTKNENYVEFCLISGIYILDDKNEKQNIIFGTPTTFYNPFTPPGLIKEFHTEKIDDIKEGTVLLFPSTLEHSVLHKNSKFPRTSIAFNVIAKYNYT